MSENSKLEDAKAAPPAPIMDNISTSKHSVRIGGQEIKYTVTTGTMVLRSETADRDLDTKPEAARASVFFTAYTKNGVKDITKRPITFSFNGGPGSSSVWRASVLDSVSQERWYFSSADRLAEFLFEASEGSANQNLQIKT